MKKNILLLIPSLDGTDIGEALVGYNLAYEISKYCNVTILTQWRKGRQRPSEQLPHLNIVEWKYFESFSFLERLMAMAKPGYLLYTWRARRWIKRALKKGIKFDLIHQITPSALRYASPAIKLGVPVVLGPVAGSLKTPKAFIAECNSGKWYTYFRLIDSVRFKYDPSLKRTYSEVDALIGSAPYVWELVKDLPVKRFEVMSGFGINSISSPPRALSKIGDKLKLLHIGRGVRTKGLRDLVRAMQYLKDRPWITLTSAGDGEEIAICKKEAIKLGVEDRVSFLGRVDRDKCDSLYRESDLFVFPSFREPSGGVVYEAMGHSLPVICVDYGGPAYHVGESAGILLPVSTPEQLAIDLAKSIKMLDNDRKALERLSFGANHRMKEIALWPNKMNWLLKLYSEIQ